MRVWVWVVLTTWARRVTTAFPPQFPLQRSPGEAEAWAVTVTDHGRAQRPALLG
jgi:hypothetical protein